MASLNFNEISNTAVVESPINIVSKDPMFHWDTHFPDRIVPCRHSDDSPVGRRKGPRRRDRKNTRYKTQPITFDEIKEVDEDITEDHNRDNVIKNQITVPFSHSMEGLGKLPTFNKHHQSGDLTRSSEGSSNESLPATASSCLNFGRNRRRIKRNRHSNSIEEIPDREDVI